MEGIQTFIIKYGRRFLRDVSQRFIEYWQRIEPESLVLSLVLILICFSILCFLYGKKYLDKRAMIIFCILDIYLVFILLITVLSRSPVAGIRVNVDLFWSYREAFSDFDSNQGRFYVDLENIVLFMPLGILITKINRNKKINIKRVTVIGLCTSLTVEVIQLYSHCGVFEFDDIFHNTIGVVLGYVLYKLCCNIKSIVSNKNYSKE